MRIASVKGDVCATRLGCVCLIVLSLFAAGCRTCGFNWLLVPEKRAMIALKNRTSVPSAADFNRAVTLQALLQPGDDRRRWSSAQAGTLEGVVVRVVEAGREAANCFSGARRDVHIEVADRVDAPPRQRVITEVTPTMRDWASTRGIDWSTSALERTLVGRRVRIEGWLFFDAEHDHEAENTRPGHAGNWRATAWELHPITSITVLR